MRKSIDHEKLLQLNLTIDFEKDYKSEEKNFETKSSSKKPLNTTRLTT